MDSLIGPGATEAAQHEASIDIFGAFLVFILFGLASTSYEATARIVRQTVEFALLQAIVEANDRDTMRDGYRSAPIADWTCYR